MGTNFDWPSGIFSSRHRCSGRVPRFTQEPDITVHLTQPASPTELYEPWETVVDSWDSLQREINALKIAHPSPFVWRGQANAAWGMKSSLYRTVAEQIDCPPAEEHVVAAERRLLRLARSQWRLDGVPGLQLFARMQHVGVPTRLIDVTYNPLIAAWFAVAETMDSNIDGAAARMFAFTVSQKKAVRLNTEWNSNTPYWFQLKSDSARRMEQWGTGLGRKLWHPPALHDRIPAQSAAFLIDGVPIDAPDNGFGRLDPSDPERWTASRLRQVSSIPMNMANLRRGTLSVDKGPVFTYLITAEAKQEIREQLETGFGYRFATIYADIEGLAEYLHRRPQLLIED